MQHPQAAVWAPTAGVNNSKIKSGSLEIYFDYSASKKINENFILYKVYVLSNNFIFPTQRLQNLGYDNIHRRLPILALSSATPVLDSLAMAVESSICPC